VTSGATYETSEVKQFTRLVERWRAAPGSGAEDNRPAPDADAVARVPLRSIRFKLLGGTVRALRSAGVPPEDWDLNRRPIGETAKFTSVVQHFRDGIPWEKTPIFRRYAIRFSEGEVIRGCRSVDEFKDVYRADMDDLYRSLQEHGFLSHQERELKKSDLPHVYIGRDGEIIFGSDGNHRLAIAHVLGFEEIRCRVVRRHASWEKLRGEITSSESRRREQRAKPEFAQHPDLQDIFAIDLRVD
jgi:hypothetical protein